MNKILITSIGAILLFPQVSSAAWWNPFSWFESDTLIQVEQQKDISTDTEIPTNSDVSNTEPTVQEKVIERTITVDNPELQKQINSLLQENATLKAQVSSLTSSLNMCKANSVSQSSTSGSGYSDFNFTYVYSVNKITFTFNTSRDIVIKKAVFHIRESDTRDAQEVGSAQRLELVKSTGANPVYYNMERSGSRFTFLGEGIPLKGKETLEAHVSIANPGGKETETFYMIPDFSEWEVWDNTTDKPVRVE